MTTAGTAMIVPPGYYGDFIPGTAVRTEGAQGWIDVTTFDDDSRQYVRGISDNNYARKCEYCGSKIMDARGNCGACGAPLP